jgi:hypothetical protein
VLLQLLMARPLFAVAVRMAEMDVAAITVFHCFADDISSSIVPAGWFAAGCDDSESTTTGQ